MYKCIKFSPNREVDCKLTTKGKIAPGAIIKGSSVLCIETSE